MARTRPQRVEFDRVATGEAVAAMEALRSAHAGGWVNVMPEVEVNEPEGGGGLFDGILGARTQSLIPYGTWTSPDGDQPGSLGLTHAKKDKVSAELAAAGVAVPDIWHLRQDHQRRGLVIEIPAGEHCDTILHWLMEAIDVLCPYQLTGSWRVEAFTRR